MALDEAGNVGVAALKIGVLVVLVLFVLDFAVTIATGLQWSQSRRPG